MSQKLLGLGLDTSRPSWGAAKFDHADGGPAPIHLVSSKQDVMAHAFNPHGNMASLGVSFPSVLSAVGSGLPTRGSRTLEDVLHMQVSLYIQVFESIGARPDVPLGIAVSTGINTLKRDLLSQAARQCGLAEVKLFDIAPLAMRTLGAGEDQAMTCLSVHIGYDHAEAALVRTARGRTRIVDTKLLPTITDEYLDAKLMEQLIIGLRDHGVVLGLTSFKPHHWRSLNEMARRTRSNLGRHPEVEAAIPEDVTDGEDIRMTLSSAAFANALWPDASAALDVLDTMLEENELSSGDLDAVIASGDSMGAFPFSHWLDERFPGLVHLADNEAVAMAAAVEAANVTEDVNMTFFETPFEESDRFRQDANGGAPPRLILDLKTVRPTAPVPVEEPAAPAKPTTPSSGPEEHAATVAEIKARLDANDLDGAEQLMSALRAQQAPAEDVASATPESSGLPVSVIDLFEAADRLLEDGQINAAVQKSHQAYATEPADPAVLSRMIEVHCKAAEQLSKPSEYAAAIQLLSCALQHDHTDTRVQHAIAERHFAHAKELCRLNNASQAIPVLESALRFNPSLQGAGDLYAELIEQETED
ncbi:MAG: tetratricopeptide repeat protein [Hyphomonadaceae bacterium]|nr:tetratricopeptide repeat protein [Hyphomonadaceae bacterium]